MPFKSEAKRRYFEANKTKLEKHYRSERQNRKSARAISNGIAYDKRVYRHLPRRGSGKGVSCPIRTEAKKHPLLR